MANPFDTGSENPFDEGSVPAAVSASPILTAPKTASPSPIDFSALNLSAPAPTNNVVTAPVKQASLASIPFTDYAKSIVNNKDAFSFGDLPSGIGGETETEPTFQLPGQQLQPTNITIAPGQPQVVPTHEVFNSLFTRSNINPITFNQAWDQALKTTPELQQVESQLNAPQNAAAYKGSGENVATNAYQLASERFSLLGSLWGNQGIDSVPAPLKSFYAPYLQSTTPQVSNASPLDDALSGIRSVVSSALTGGKTALQQSEASAPAAGSLTDFYFGGGAERALDVGATSLGNAFSGALQKAQQAITAFQNPNSTAAQKFGATGEAAIGMLNAFFVPITSTLATISVVPGVGRVADAFNNIFAAIGGGAAGVAGNAIDDAPISQSTKDALKPLAEDASALVAQILAGHAGAEAIGPLSDKVGQIGDALQEHISNMPPESFQRGAIRNPFYIDPASPEAKGQVGELAIEKDPAKITETLKDMGVQSDIAEKVAPKIAASTDPSEISDILQVAKGMQNLSDGDYVGKSSDLSEFNEPPQAVSESNETEPTETAVPTEEDTVRENPEAPTANEKETEAESPFSNAKFSIPKDLRPLATEARSALKYPTADDFAKDVLHSEAFGFSKGAADAFRDMYKIPTDNTLDQRMPIIENALKDFYNKVRSVSPEEPKISVGKGTRVRTPEERAAQEEAAADAGPKKIVDKIPTPKPDDKTTTPADELQQLPKDELGSFAPIVKDAAPTPKGRLHILDYLSTPEYVLDRLGLSDAWKGVRQAFEKYLDNKNIELKKVQAWKDSVKGIPGNERVIFQYLDGREKDVMSGMSDQELGVAREIRSYLKEWADRLKLPEDSRLPHYITHLFEPSAAAEREGASIFDDPDFARMMQDQPAKSVYDPFLEKRLGKKGYREDVWASLDAYVKRATRKEAMDPALERLEHDAAKLDDLSYKYVTKLSHRINMRPTDTEKLLDSLITQSKVGYRFGERPTAYLSSKLRSLFYRGRLGLNFSSAIRNLTQGVNTYAKLGERYTVVGYSKLVYRLMSRNLDELYDNHVLEEEFVQDQKVGVYKTALQKLDPILYGLFEQAEKINRGAAYFGAKSKAVGMGMDESAAVDYAKRIVRETQFAFGSIDTPVALNDDIAKTLTQLQTYNIKQIEMLARMAKNKEFAGLIRFTIGSVVAVNTIGKLFGMNLLQQLFPTVGIGGAPISSLASHVVGAFSSNTQTKASAISGLQSDAASLFPAGAQIRKTVQGLNAYYAGKDVTPTGKTRYTIPHNILTGLQAGFFGKSALPQAQEYYNAIGKPKAAKGNPFD